MYFIIQNEERPFSARHETSIAIKYKIDKFDPYKEEKHKTAKENLEKNVWNS